MSTQKEYAKYEYAFTRPCTQLSEAEQADLRAAGSGSSVPPAVPQPSVQQAVHRCLTYLGDLCRYQSQVRGCDYRV